MNVRAFVLGLCLIAAIPLLGREKTDVMVMRNGDRVTCEIKGLNSGILYVNFDYIDGTASVDWSKVARLESNQLFVVKTQEGKVYSGTLRMAESTRDRPVTIEIVRARDGQAVLKRSEIVQMIATSDRFWQRFSGGLNVGAIYSKGNDSTQYTFGTDAAYIRERWHAHMRLDSTLASSSGANASTRNSLQFGAFRLMPAESWFYAGLGSLLQSSEQGIAIQSTIGGGVGRFVKNTNRASLAVLGGGAWQSTKYEHANAHLGQQNLAAAMVYAEAKMFRFSRTNLDLTAALLPSVSDSGRVRFNLNSTYYVKMFNNLKWDLSLYGNWDNRPPVGLSGSDYGTSAGITWTFGLK